MKPRCVYRAYNIRDTSTKNLLLVKVFGKVNVKLECYIDLELITVNIQNINPVLTMTINTLGESCHVARDKNQLDHVLSIKRSSLHLE